MQALIELIASFVAMLAAVALSQFGLNLDAPQRPKQEIHRVHDCGGEKPATTVLAASANTKRDC